MSLGSFGNIRLSDIEISDIEILYTFTPSRNVPLSGNFQKLNSIDVLSQTQNPNSINENEILPGFYNLRLPVDFFNQKGFYYILLKPREIRTTIKDVGILFNNPSIQGLVIDTQNGFTSQDTSLSNVNNSLVGYRIEYINSVDKSKIPNKFVIITSSNKCIPINNISVEDNNATKSYKLDNSGSILFLTVTPSSESFITPNTLPNIGNLNQDIILTNTNMNPIMLELEVVEHDMDTLSWEMGGNRIVDVKNSMYTIYNDNNEIYKQVRVSKKQNFITGEFDYELSEKMNDIDESQNFNNIKGL